MKTKLLLGVSLVGVLTLRADSLRLRDGRVITGTLQSATRDEIRFQRDGGGTDRYDVGNVDSITFGNNQFTTGDRSGRETSQYNDQQPRYGNRVGNADRYRDREQTFGRSGTVIPAGTVVTVRMIDSIDSDASHVGETYRASLDQPLIVNGQTVAPAGSDASVQVVRIQQGGRITGNEDITLALASFTANGRTYDVNTSNESVSSGSRGKQSAEVIGGGAALGAIIGAIAGGGKGAAIGAGAGGALGAGAQVLRGQRVKVPSEARLSFTLNRDLVL